MEGLKLFLTGPPGSGKTTVIQRMLECLHAPASGFHTRAIHLAGRRVGFQIVTVDGQEGVLAHRELLSPFRVGVYRVDIENLESIAVSSILNRPPEEILVIDEVGKMECLSAAFRHAVRSALKGPNPVVGSVGLRGGGFMEEVRQWPGLRLIHVTPSNRDELPAVICKKFQK